MIIIANGIAPLIVREARQRQLDAALPQALIDDARAAAHAALASRTALSSVQEALGAPGVPWMLWKGPALATQAWGEVAMRHFADLDVVVAPHDLERGAAALRSAGWRPRAGMDARQQRVLQWGEGARAFERESHEPLIELHWRFAAWRHAAMPSVAQAFSGAIELPVLGVPCRVPAGPLATWLLAMHAMKHGWSKAEDLVTLVRIAAQGAEGLDPRAIAVPLGLDPTPLEFARGLATRLVDDAPDGMADRPPHGDRASIDGAIARMCAGEGSWRPDLAWELARVRGPVGRARYLLGATLAPTMMEWDWIRLPGPLAWLYPAVRVTRLLRRETSR